MRHAQEEDMQMTDDLAALLPYTLAGMAASAAYPEHPAYEQAMMVEPNSPRVDAMSPLSMDLTNNSMDLSGMQGQQAQSMQEQPGQRTGRSALPYTSAAADFTRNITSGIPALSTLVEEDEEASGHGLHEDDNWHEANPRGAADQSDWSPAGRLPESALQQVQPGSIGGGPLQTEAAVGSPDGRRLLAGNALEDLVVSPATPFMSLTTGGASLGGHGPGAMDDTDELKNKWGFTPGADDTLDASHGRLVMGDTTYNHVYGSSTTGDITKSMQANQNTGASTTLCAWHLRGNHTLLGMCTC
ncbi:uncharacterized protein HaLaN_01493 [Haematococcus lacustris]|uniref:Uncharacterized protein n=1 Tax=Haematococcus lacustris TaxID=44745 RepID=A0A699YBV4_HAELA|nr:uncharacterized protein HaLaN_01493 [Haematococcus lacustris]